MYPKTTQHPNSLLLYMNPASEFPIHDDRLTGNSSPVYTGRGPSTVSFDPYHHPGRIVFLIPAHPHNSAASSLLRGRVPTGLPRGGLTSQDEDSVTAYQGSEGSNVTGEWAEDGQKTVRPSAWAIAMAHRPSPSRISQSQSPTVSNGSTIPWHLFADDRDRSSPLDRHAHHPSSELSYLMPNVGVSYCSQCLRDL